MNHSACTVLYINVSCCDKNGKSIWRFEDTSVLRSPCGVVVDNQGFVFVAGEKSGSPRAMCYDKNNNKIIVCNTGKKVLLFEIE